MLTKLPKSKPTFVIADMYRHYSYAMELYVGFAGIVFGAWILLHKNLVHSVDAVNDIIGLSYTLLGFMTAGCVIFFPRYRNKFAFLNFVGFTYLTIYFLVLSNWAMLLVYLYLALYEFGLYLKIKGVIR